MVDVQLIRVRAAFRCLFVAFTLQFDGEDDSVAVCRTI